MTSRAADGLQTEPSYLLSSLRTSSPWCVVNASDDTIPRTSEAGKIADWRSHLFKQEALVEARHEDEGKGQPSMSSRLSSRMSSWVIGLTSLSFILLQSACAAVMALSGLRLAIGVGSLTAAATGVRFLAAIHGEAIRIPMEVLAIGGPAVNLYVIWRIRSLRGRASSQWRVGPVTPAKKRAESVQIMLALLTLLLVAVEWVIHIHQHGSI